MNEECSIVYEDNPEESASDTKQQTPEKSDTDEPTTLGIECEMPPQGLEPWTHGLRVRCSTN